MKQTPEIKKSKKLARFDENFKLLSKFLKKEKRYPGKAEDPKLYNWMTQLMTAKANGKLEPEMVNRLNKIGFIWSRIEFKRSQKRIDSKQELAPSKIDTRWANRLEELIAYRERNPKKWPIVEAADPFENKLGIWCMTLRKRLREGKLDDKWINELKGIGFNFEGRLDNWKVRFEKLKQFLELNKKLPEPKSELYTWARIQHTNYDELSRDRQKLLKTIQFQKYYEGKGWANWLEKLKRFIKRNEKTPTAKTDKALYYWLSNQRKKYQEGRLNETEAVRLIELGVDLTPMRNPEKVWQSKFELLKHFRKINPDRWPSHAGELPEQRLYEWCQSQRQKFAAGKAEKRMKLTTDQIKKLNGMGFYWTAKERNERIWEENFKSLAAFMSKSKGVKTIPRIENGVINKHYSWLQDQKKAINAGQLSLEKMRMLKGLGVI